jgi:hypothetical protein
MSFPLESTSMESAVQFRFWSLKIHSSTAHFTPFGMNDHLPNVGCPTEQLNILPVLAVGWYNQIACDGISQYPVKEQLLWRSVKSILS